ELNRLVIRFWWREVAKNEKKTLGLLIEILPLSTRREGLVFRDFSTLKQVLVTKQCWRILQYPNLLPSQLLKSVYFPTSSILTFTNRVRLSRG
ncbi:hypothetical protein LINPERHAP1_LOCUS34774, partial [Linum perenne]